MGKTTMNMNVNSLAGTPMYMAPEVITGGDIGRKGSMDIWSLACCIVQMATGRRPWSTLENEWSVMYHVVTGHPPLPDASQLSSLGIDFLKECFTRNPAKRPTAQELLEHPWITEFLADPEAVGFNDAGAQDCLLGNDPSYESQPALCRSTTNSLAVGEVTLYNNEHADPYYLPPPPNVTTRDFAPFHPITRRDSSDSGSLVRSVDERMPPSRPDSPY